MKLSHYYWQREDTNGQGKKIQSEKMGGENRKKTASQVYTGRRWLVPSIMRSLRGALLSRTSLQLGRAIDGSETSENASVYVLLIRMYYNHTFCTYLPGKTLTRVKKANTDSHAIA